jgi:poly(A) polymerase
VFVPPSRNKPACRRQDALAIAARLSKSGHIAYFAGGCVRDMLLGLEPTDYDIATDARPDKVRELFPKTQEVGAAFGVILVRYGRSVVEVATFRSDGPYTDGRRPDSVHFATAEQDAQRRDFTINGLFLDPADDQVIDYVGGRDDLAKRRLRAIGDAKKRFDEDHLRLLRGIRFASRFDLQIEPATAAAIRNGAPRLKGISPERIADELRLMLTPVTRARAWPTLWEYDLAPVIFRLFAISRGPALFAAVSPAEPISFALALAAATLETIGKSILEKAEIHRLVSTIRTLLRISNEESDAMEAILASLPPLLDKSEPTLAMKKRFLAQPTSADARRLLAALATIGQFTARATALEAEFALLEKTNFAPAPLLTGDDLTAVGLTPGPAFKRLLDLAYDAQLEGRVTAKAAAMELIGKTSESDGLASPLRVPEDAIYPDEKFTQYLLVKRSVDDKSGFLNRAGYELSRWPSLRDAIRSLAGNVDASLDHVDAHGRYWRCEGELIGPIGRLFVVLIFQERAIDGRFRFVTLLPLKRKRP